MMDPNVHPQHMNGLKHFVYVWRVCGNSFYVSLGPQPIHPVIICSPAVTQEISQLPKFFANKYGGSGMWHDGRFICLSSAFDWSQIPSLCMECMWEPFHVGLWLHPKSTSKNIGKKTSDPNPNPNPNPHNMAKTAEDIK